MKTIRNNSDFLLLKFPIGPNYFPCSFLTKKCAAPRPPGQRRFLHGFDDCRPAQFPALFPLPGICLGGWLATDGVHRK